MSENKNVERSMQLMQMRHRVDYYTYDMSISELLSRIKAGLIDISPDYQRKFRWDEKRRSVFIESIFLDIPIPSIFAARKPTGEWEVIDGVQRISTIVQFAGDQQIREKIELNEPLRLSGLQKLDLFNDSTFEDLSKESQLLFMDSTLKIINLNDKSNYEVRFDLFERLNTGGITLSPQEVRDSVYQGQFIDYVYDLSEYSSYKSSVKFTENNERNGFAQEMIIRFFALLYDQSNYTQDLKRFFNDFTRKSSQEKFDYIEADKIFKRTFDIISKNLPSGVVGRQKKKETPPALFEAISVGVAKSITSTKKPHYGLLPEIMVSPELTQFLGDGSNSRKKMESRINYVFEALSGKGV